MVALNESSGKLAGKIGYDLHHVKKGTVTVAGAPSDDVHPKTLKSILRQAELEKE